MTREEEFLKRLLATFRVEAKEHLAGISSGLIELEKQPPPEKQKEIVEVVFREAHSLKGAARSVDLGSVELLCQAMESLFAAIKRGELALSTPLFDLLNDATDLVERLVSLSDSALTADDRRAVQTIKQKLAAAAKGILPPPPAGGKGPVAEKSDALPRLPVPEERLAAPDVGRTQPEQQPPAVSQPESRLLIAPAPAAKGGAGVETIRISAAKLDALLLKTEELVAAKLAARQHARLARELKTMLDAWKEQCSKTAFDGMKGGQRELQELNLAFLRKFETGLIGLRKAADEDYRSIGGMVDNLLDDMKSVMMFPVSSMFEAFPKLVRDMAREQGKEIVLTMEGSDIEIDNRILQVIKDPLIHLLRNAIDHGIEAPEARRQKNKPEKGGLRIAVAQKDSGKVEIVVADDGAGIDVDKVRASAVRQGIITEEQSAAMSNEEALNLIFESGISTSAMLTTVSGRGLGMAIVRGNVEKLGGTVSATTAPGAGTTFSILLPLSLATFRGMLIESGGQVFAVPTMHVERIVRIPCGEVRTVENRETIPVNGKAVALARLDDVLGLSRKPVGDKDAGLTVMVVQTGEKQLAFAIDAMLYEDEILLKSLGKQLSRVRNVAGATVLGSGRVVPILNVADLIKSALRLAAGGGGTVTVDRGKKETAAQSILVVEDSITARTLFVNILESAGYQVTAAVDGIDAFTKLGEGRFDLVVSDIAMPRMDGFELTKRIRADTMISDLPVVIVTGLESAEDKKRGIEVGANAYIVKSSFDQSNLLEAIKRLI